MVRNTSLAAYYEIKNNGLLSKRRFQVYDYIYHNGAKTGAEVSLALKAAGAVSETVRNRITELVKLGVVAELRTVICPVTNRSVFLYDVTDKLPVDYEKPETKTQKIKRLEKKIKSLLKIKNVLERTYKNVPESRAFIRKALEK